MIVPIIIFILVIIFYFLLFKIIKFDKNILLFIVVALFFSAISPYIITEFQIILSFLLSIVLAYLFSNHIKYSEKKHITFYIFPLIYFIVISTMTLMKYYSFNMAMLDFGNMLQPIYNTGNGNFMALSRFGANINRFSMHQEFIYLIFVPFVKLFPSGATLLIMQTLFISLSSIAIYGIGKILVKNELKAKALAILYLLYTPLSFSNLVEFHGDTIAIFFISFSIYFLLRKKNLLFFIFSVLSMMCKEYIALIFIMLAIYIFIFDKEHKNGIILFFISFLYYFVFLVFFKHLFPNSNFIEGMHYGGNKITLLKNMFILFKWENIIYLFAPFLFILLKKPKYLIPTLPIFAGILLSKHSNVADVRWHHWSTILPFLFVAFIAVLADIEKLKIRSKIIISDFYRFIFIYFIAFSFFTGGSAFSYRFWHPAEYYFFGNKETFKITKYDRAVLIKIKEFKDPDLFITTTTNLASQVCMRKNINLLMWGNKEAIDRSDYVIYNEKEVYINENRFKRMKNSINYVRNSNKFVKISDYPLEVYKKNK